MGENIQLKLRCVAIDTVSYDGIGIVRFEGHGENFSGILSLRVEDKATLAKFKEGDDHNIMVTLG
jgi:hypothetical protein